MCTMTWQRDENGYEVFFNRDELKTRSRALPPELQSTEEGVRYLAPIDPDAGGTWMLVNEYGVTVSLLNRWHEGASDEAGVKSKSRGQLVLSFANAKCASDVIEQLKKTDCSRFKPFTLVVLDKLEMQAQAWNGEFLLIEVTAAPLTSSSYCFSEVRRARCDRYTLLVKHDPASLQDYHASHEEPSAYTVRMNRPDAQTWSRTRLSVGSEDISWQYLEEMLDLGGDGIEHHTQLDLK